MYLLGSGLNPFRGFFLFIGNWCFADANIGYHRCMAIKRPPNVIQRLCRFFGPVEPVAGVRTRKRIATLKDVGLGFGEDRACGNELFSNSPQAWASPNDPRLLAGRLPCCPTRVARRLPYHVLVAKVHSVTELGRPSRKPSADRRSKLAARVELVVDCALIATVAILFAYLAGWISSGSITSVTLIEDLQAHQGHP